MIRKKTNTVIPWREYKKGITYQQMFQEYSLPFNAKIISFRELPWDSENPYSLEKKYLDKGFSPAISISNNSLYGELICTVKYPDNSDVDDIPF